MYFNAMGIQRKGGTHLFEDVEEQGEKSLVKGKLRFSFWNALGYPFAWNAPTHKWGRSSTRAGRSANSLPHIPQHPRHLEPPRANQTIVFWPAPSTQLVVAGRRSLPVARRLETTLQSCKDPLGVQIFLHEVRCYPWRTTSSEGERPSILNSPTSCFLEPEWAGYALLPHRLSNCLSLLLANW